MSMGVGLALLPDIINEKDESPDLILAYNSQPIIFFLSDRHGWNPDKPAKSRTILDDKMA